MSIKVDGLVIKTIFMQINGKTIGDFIGGHKIYMKWDSVKLYISWSMQYHDLSVKYIFHNDSHTQHIKCTGVSGMERSNFRVHAYCIVFYLL